MIVRQKGARAVDADGPFFTDRLFPADHHGRAEAPGVAVPMGPVIFPQIARGPGEGEAAPEGNGAVPLHLLIEMEGVVVDVAVFIEPVIGVFELDLHRMGGTRLFYAGGHRRFSAAVSASAASPMKMPVGPSALPMTEAVSDGGTVSAGRAGSAARTEEPERRQPAQTSAAAVHTFIQVPSFFIVYDVLVYHIRALTGQPSVLMQENHRRSVRAAEKFLYGFCGRGSGDISRTPGKHAVKLCTAGKHK